MELPPPPGRVPRTNVYNGWKGTFYSRDNLVTLPETENNTDHDREGKGKSSRLGVGTLEVYGGISRPKAQGGRAIFPIR